MRHTIGYKQGFIHISVIDGQEIIYVQVNKYAYAIIVKSVIGAKRMITQDTNWG